MAFYFYLSTKIIMVFITKSYQDLFGVRSYINAKEILMQLNSNKTTMENDTMIQEIAFTI